MKTCRYIDTYSYHTLHEQFNASLLAMCAHVFDRVEYRSGVSSHRRVEKLLRSADLCLDNISWQRIVVLGGGFSRVHTILRLLLSALQNICIVLFTSSKTMLLFNYNNLFSLFTVNLICRIFNRKVVVFCHGEMELIMDKQQWGGFFVRAQRKIASKFFLSPKRRSRLYFAVMGDSILFNVSKVVAPMLVDRFISVDHSYIFGSTQPKPDQGTPLQIGTVGVLTHAKGYDAICDLARILKENNQVSLSVTGRIFGNSATLETLGVDLPRAKGVLPLEDDEFRSRIERLDYILFLYPTNSYKMIASGAVMDSIDKARPIVSLTNEYFEYLFDKYGVFGYLVRDTEELALLLNRIGKEKLGALSVDFDRLRERFSPLALSVELSSALQKIGYL